MYSVMFWNSYTYTSYSLLTNLFSLSGILQQYSLIQVSYWMLFYALEVYWSLKFPFSYKRAKDGGKLRYFSATTVFISVVFPSLALILAADEFYPTTIVYSACSSRNPTLFNLVSILHLSLTMYICSVVILLNIQELCKVKELIITVTLNYLMYSYVEIL